MASHSVTIKKRFFNECYLQYLENKHRVTVFYGGAGSGKSVFAIQRAIIKALKSERKCLVVRKFTITIRDSIFAEFQNQLRKFDLLDRCKVSLSNFTITLPNGSTFVFKGMDDPEKIKSISGIDDILIEEATELTLDDYSQLSLRLRSQKPNNQITMMFNPVSKSNWVYKQFFEMEIPEDTVVVHTTYKDNKFLPDSYVQALEQMAASNPVYYRIYALGEFASLSKLVYENTEVREFNYRQVLKRKDTTAYFGLDFGYSNDPSAFVACVVDPVNKELYIFDEHYEKGMLNDEIFNMIIEKGYGKEIITADSSEPKSIQEIKNRGVRRIKSARKGKDSVMHGIQFLQQYKIIIHPRCKNFKEEVDNYSWKKDKKTNEYLNVPVDEFNHLLDALRYAIEDLVPRGRMRSLNKSLFGL